MCKSLTLLILAIRSPFSKHPLHCSPQPVSIFLSFLTGKLHKSMLAKSIFSSKERERGNYVYMHLIVERMCAILMVLPLKVEVIVYTVQCIYTLS